jgi:mRNA interferase HigB
MRIISRKALVQFWTKHAASKRPLIAWFAVVKAAEWRHFADTRKTYSSADLVKVPSGNLVTVFNVGGNDYRIIAAIHYNKGTVYILRVLTHAEYDRRDWVRNL